MHSPHLGAVPRLASAPIHQRPIVTVVEIPREITRKETQSDTNPESRPGRNKSEKTEETPTNARFSVERPPSNKNSNSACFANPGVEDFYRGAQRRLTSTSRALDGVIDDVAYPLYAERNAPRNLETRQMATERTPTYTTARWKPPASHDPRAGRCSVSSLDQQVGSRVRGWTLAGAADIYHHPRVENCWPEQGKGEGAARQRARR